MCISFLYRCQFRQSLRGPLVYLFPQNILGNFGVEFLQHNLGKTNFGIRFTKSWCVWVANYMIKYKFVTPKSMNLHYQQIFLLVELGKILEAKFKKFLGKGHY